MKWDEIVTKLHLEYSKEIGITTKIEAYIQYIVLKKILKAFPLNTEEITEMKSKIDRRVQW